MIKILVVDDESGIRSLLTEILSDEGYMVYQAEDAKAARKIMSRERFNLILLDIWMPDTDGITLLREWVGRGELERTFVVMMSGHGSIESATEAVRLGAKDFMEKPISMTALLDTVHRLLEEWNRTFSLPIDHKATPGDAPRVKHLQEETAEEPLEPARSAPHLELPHDATESECYIRFSLDTLRTLDTLRKRILSPCVDVNRALKVFRMLEEHPETNVMSAQSIAHHALKSTLMGLAHRRLDTHDFDWILSTTPRAKQEEYLTRVCWAVHKTFEGVTHANSLTKADELARYTVYKKKNSGRKIRPFEEALIKTTHIIGSGLSPQDLPREVSDDGILRLPAVEPIQNTRLTRADNEAEALAEGVDDDLFEPCTTFGIQNLKRPLKLHFPPLSYGPDLANDVRTSLAVCTMPTLPCLYVKAYNLLIDYNQTLKDCRDAIERSYLLTHLFAEDFAVASVARIAMVERTHLYRKLKFLGIQPTEINRIWRYLKSQQPGTEADAAASNIEGESLPKGYDNFEDFENFEDFNEFNEVFDERDFFKENAD